jgi:fatty acid desaturase
MTLAPERLTPQHLTPQTHPRAHASTKPSGINPRLSVTSLTPRPQRPALKKSGRPNPAAHLTPEQIEGIGVELDAMRKEVMDSRGERDAAYIRKVIKVQRYLEMGSRAVLLFSGVKVKGFRPAWWIGTAGLSVAKILENMEIGHNVMHGQWDWMRDPKIHSTAWEWDNASPSSQWKHSHNEMHHTFTNVHRARQRPRLRHPARRRGPAVEPVPPLPADLARRQCTALRVRHRGLRPRARRLPRQAQADDRGGEGDVPRRRRGGRRKIRARPPRTMSCTRPWRGDLHRLGPYDPHGQRRRQPRAQRVDQHGHHLRALPPGIATFEKTSIEGETRGEWYLRQMLGSGNISGSKAMHVMTGNLSHQIEHHLFPDMPSNRYAEIAPRIRDLMERHDLPYVTGSLPKQAASVYWKVIELSLPNKVEGRRRRDIVRLSLKKAWKKKSLGRF